MRSSVADRRSATPTAKSAKSFRSSALSDAVLDEDGDIPFPEDVTGMTLINVFEVYLYLLYSFNFDAII